MNESQARDLGRLITTRRTKREVSARAIERATGIPKTWVRNLEEGKYRNPGVDRLLALALVLGIDPEEINQVTDGYLALRLPSTRTYFRAKHAMDHEDIDRLIDHLDIKD